MSVMPVLSRVCHCFPVCDHFQPVVGLIIQKSATQVSPRFEWGANAPGLRA